MEAVTIKLKDNLCLSVPVPPNAVAYKLDTTKADSSAGKPVRRLTVMFALRLKTDECAGDIINRLKDAKQWEYMTMNGRFGSSYASAPFAAMEYEIGENDIVKPDRELLTAYSSASLFAPASEGRAFSSLEEMETYIKNRSAKTTAAS